MNARLLGFFSGFPTRHFPADIADRLRSALTVRDSLVFVSAWPADHEQNDADSAGMHGMFVECGMEFAHYAVIDDRTDVRAAQRLIRGASCIFLMGGNATLQFRLMREKEILRDIRDSGAVILGVSAGAINMGRHSLDIAESPVPYDGLGLADVTAKAHVSPESHELMQALLLVSIEQALPICAMEDESAIFIDRDSATYVGSIRLLNNSQICELSSEALYDLIFGRR